MREGSYTTSKNGEPLRVEFTDSDVLRDVADLWAVVQGDYNGTPSMASEQLKSMLANLQAGSPLSDAEFAELNRIRKRYAAQLTNFRRSPDNSSEGFVPPGDVGTGRVRESASYKTPSTTALDRAATSPHLLDTVKHDMAHAAQHVKRLFDPDVKADPQSQQFNAEHALNHLESAQGHATKLDKHLSSHPSDPKAWTKERAALKSMREAARLGIRNLREGAAPEPPNYRSATEPGEECGTCSMFDHGICWGYGNKPVDEDYVCDSWDQDPDWRTQDAQADMVEAAAPAVTKADNDKRQTVCVDFDGVIHQGAHGMPGEVEGGPSDGAKEGLAQLAGMYDVVVLTARQDLDAVRDWLQGAGLARYITEVTNIKPPAVAYLDDRAVHFTSWPEAVKAADPEVATSQPVVAKESRVLGLSNRGLLTRGP